MPWILWGMMGSISGYILLRKLKNWPPESHEGDWKTGAFPFETWLLVRGHGSVSGDMAPFQGVVRFYEIKLLPVVHWLWISSGSLGINLFVCIRVFFCSTAEKSKNLVSRNTFKHMLKPKIINRTRIPIHNPNPCFLKKQIGESSCNLVRHFFTIR